ncbi:hypothetical protein [Pseudanabaena sp. FACHB-1998]|uniref:hypothetical protein n=1 Tax=Pseudanabaena sp. FACHB-1998 TaxID=2692858 RepID=UPI00168169DB|nr:hypothetical protein [Pseudanabaena sp. FACHB-1998]
MLKAIAISLHKPMIATHLKSNNDRLLLSNMLNVQSDRPFIAQTSDRNSSQIKQRSPIFSDTLNVQRGRPLIPKSNDRNLSQIK